MSKALKLLAGTSGYSYKEWRGSFYPPELHPDEWLGYYASELPTVEINNTFYRMPRKQVVETWRDSVPESFRFVLKASRRITHQSRLKDTEEPMSYLLHRAEVLGSRLGALLFQLPPYMPLNLERLQSFQELLPEHVPVAFEFRHDSWLDPAVDEALLARGHARVATHDSETGTDPLLPGPLVYLRLRAPSYTAASLRSWQKKIAATGAAEAFVFFKHEDAAGGPKLAARFLALASDSQTPLDRAAPKRAAQKKAVPEKAAPAQARDSRPGAAAPARAKARTRKKPVRRKPT